MPHTNIKYDNSVRNAWIIAAFLWFIFIFAAVCDRRLEYQETENAWLNARKELREWPRYRGDDLQNLEPGDPILVEGIVSSKNTPLIDDLIIGCDMHYRRHHLQRSEWQSRQIFRQAFLVKLEMGLVTAQIEFPCPLQLAPYDIDPGRVGIQLEHWRSRRYGFEKGDQITLVGTVDRHHWQATGRFRGPGYTPPPDFDPKTLPLPIKVSHHYAGTISQTLRTLETP